MTIESLKWNKVSFGDVAKCLTISTKDPLSEGLDRYVGLEHIEPGNIHIKTWGKIVDGTTFTRVFRKGQVLFGKRRAYQKKAAVAEFSGICSGDILVCEAIEDAVIPELLPFIVQSDRFFEYAIKTSAGSLSPRTKFKDLAKFTFKLPSKHDDQKLIANLLWSVDYVEDCLEKLKLANDRAGRSLLKTAIRFGFSKVKMVKAEIYSPYQTNVAVEEIPFNWQVLKISDIVDSVQTGFAEGARDENGIQQLRMQNVGRDCSLVLDDVIRVPKREGYEKYLLKKLDVLFNNTNSEDLVGKSILFLNHEEPMVFSNHFTRLRVKSNLILPNYLYLWLRYHFEIGLFERRCTRWIGQAAVQTENLLSLHILVPPLPTQIEIVNRIFMQDQLTDKIKIHLEKTKKIKKAILNQLLG